LLLRLVGGARSAAHGHATAPTGLPPDGTRLVFLSDRDLPPDEFLDGDMPRGASVDLAHATGRVLGCPVEMRLWFASAAYVLMTALRRIGLAHTTFATATRCVFRSIPAGDSDGSQPLFPTHSSRP